MMENRQPPAHAAAVLLLPCLRPAPAAGVLLLLLPMHFWCCSPRAWPLQVLPQPGHSDLLSADWCLLGCGGAEVLLYGWVEEA